MTRMMGMALILGLLSGCSWQEDTEVVGTGAVIEQRQPLGEIDKVAAMVPATIRILAGDKPGLSIRGQENLLPLLSVTERGNQLEIEVEDGYKLAPTEPLELTITLPRLRELALAGNSQGEIGHFKGDKLVLSLAGSGGIQAKRLELDSLEGNIAGSGGLDLGSGTVRTLELNIAGTGDVQGSRLESGEAEVNIAGSGDVEVRAKERLNINIAGSGSIAYWGDPKVEQRVAGSGSVTREGS